MRDNAIKDFVEQSISEKDKMHEISYKACAFEGFVDKNIRYIEDFQLLDENLWARFVQQFREDADYDAGWRGEYWGKMMRGAAMTYAYTKNHKLYKILKKTVNDMIESADSDGRISSYGRSHEFDGWDIWSRKYVMLGMQYFMEICDDLEFNSHIVESMKGQADYIISKIGDGENKKDITAATRHWRGLNSSSILEPIVRLYNITGEPRYFDFAKYIVDRGGTDVVNIFELALENKLYPYQYPVTKAYEMTSCFEGLLEFYRITGIEKYRVALINFADRILESDFTVIGSCGCTHELFDHSTVRQANSTNDKIMQETCVTVTLMKFMFQMTRLTGDSKYVDAFEISMYNAYFGAINTDKVIEKDTVARECNGCITEPLPFDSYSPLTAGTRGNGIGGLKIMSDKHYYGCCACIGSAGNGLIPKMAVMATNDGYMLNLFIDGIIAITDDLVLDVKTDYPVSGKIEIKVDSEDEFALYIRNPGWSEGTEITINNELVAVSEGYIKLVRRWHRGDSIKISLDMRTRVVYPVKYEPELLMNKVIWGHNYMISTYDEQDPEAMNKLALVRGPIALAQENRLGYSVDDPVDICINDSDCVDISFPDKDIAPYEHILEVRIPLRNGDFMTMTDYSSAGKLWNEESKMAVWIRTARSTVDKK